MTEIHKRRVNDVLQAIENRIKVNESGNFNEWFERGSTIPNIRLPIIKVYLRYTFRRMGEKETRDTIRTLEISNIECSPQRKGIFTYFLEGLHRIALAHNVFAIVVENVHNDSWRKRFDSSELWEPATFMGERCFYWEVSKTLKKVPLVDGLKASEVVTIKQDERVETPVEQVRRECLDRIVAFEAWVANFPGYRDGTKEGISEANMRIYVDSNNKLCWNLHNASDREEKNTSVATLVAVVGWLKILGNLILATDREFRDRSKGACDGFDLWLQEQGVPRSSS